MQTNSFAFSLRGVWSIFSSSRDQIWGADAVAAWLGHFSHTLALLRHGSLGIASDSVNGRAVVPLF